MASRPKTLKSFQFTVQQIADALRQTAATTNGIERTLADFSLGRTQTLPVRSLVLKLFGFPLAHRAGPAGIDDAKPTTTFG